MIRSLTRFEVRNAEAALSAFYPGGARGSLPVGIDALDVRGFLREVFEASPLEPVLGLRLAIWIVALAPLFVLKRAATLASLGQHDREKVIAALVASPTYAIRQLVIALKAIGGLLYCAAPEVRAVMTAPRSGTSLVRLHARASAPKSSGAIAAPRAEKVEDAHTGVAS